MKQAAVHRRVIKLGGSLLAAPDLVSRIESWLNRQPKASENLWIIGGGEIVEGLRVYDQIHLLDPVAMHWRCVRQMRATFEILAELFPAWSQIASESEFGAACGRGRFAPQTLIAADTFFTPANDGHLPTDWTTTSDSIAAFLAQQTDADELVLLKSCEISAEATIAELVANGTIDQAFLVASKGLPLVRAESH